MKQIGFLILFVLLAATVFAQSTNEDFPTPVVQNEISGTIAARDIGDSRLTRHFYTFFADNGDLNVALETQNFDGDVDLFEAPTMRPLVKITIAAESQTSQTSRVVYFRKRGQVVLRIEGRSLTNDPAVYRFAFSGSFAAASDLPEPAADVEPKVAEKSNPNAVAKVNSAGTIIEVLERPKTASEPTAANTAAKRSPANPEPRRSRTPRKPVAKAKPITKRAEPTERNPVETTTENPPAKTVESVATRKPTARNSRPKATPTARATNSARAAGAKKPGAKKTVGKADEASTEPDPLANVQLIILLKNGERVERVMSDVFNVSVDKGQITVVTKSGRIERYNLLEVQKMTIEQ